MFSHILGYLAHFETKNNWKPCGHIGGTVSNFRKCGCCFYSTIVYSFFHFVSCLFLVVFSCFSCFLLSSSVFLCSLSIVPANKRTSPNKQQSKTTNKSYQQGNKEKTERQRKKHIKKTRQQRRQKIRPSKERKKQRRKESKTAKTRETEKENEKGG